MGYPSPATDRASWYSCVVGDYVLPPDATLGSITVEAESGHKHDKKKSAGKNKSKTTKQGKEDVKIKIHCEFVAAGWEDGPGGAGWDTILTALDPNGDATGGPFAFSHPDTNRRGVKSIMIDKIGKVVWKGHHGSVEIECGEWTEPTKATTGGATATPSADAKTTTTVHGFGSNNNTITYGSGASTSQGGVPTGQVNGSSYNPVSNPGAPSNAP